MNLPDLIQTLQAAADTIRDAEGIDPAAIEVHVAADVETWGKHALVGSVLSSGDRLYLCDDGGTREALKGYVLTHGLAHH